MITSDKLYLCSYIKKHLYYDVFISFTLLDMNCYLSIESLFIGILILKLYIVQPCFNPDDKETGIETEF